MSLGPLGELTNIDLDDRLLQRICGDLRSLCGDETSKEGKQTELIKELTSKVFRLTQVNKDVYKSLFQAKNQHFAEEFELRRKIQDLEAYCEKEDVERTAVIAENNRLKLRTEELESQLQHQGQHTQQLSQELRLITQLVGELGGQALSALNTEGAFSFRLKPNLLEEQLKALKDGLRKLSGGVPEAMSVQTYRSQVMNLFDGLSISARQDKYFQQKYRKDIQEWQQAVALLQDQLQNVLAQRARLAQEKQTLAEVGQQLRNQLYQVQERLSAAQCQVSTVQQRDKELEQLHQQKIKQLQLSLQQCFSREQSLGKQLSQLSCAFKSSQTTSMQAIQELQAQSESLRAQVREGQAQSSKLKVELETARRNFQAKESYLRDTISRLNQNLADFQASKQELEAQLTSSSAVYGDLQSALRQNSRENQKLREKLHTMENALKEKACQLSSLWQEHCTQSQQLAKAKERVVCLQQTLEIKVDQISCLRSSQQERLEENRQLRLSYEQAGFDLKERIARVGDKLEQAIREKEAASAAAGQSQLEAKSHFEQSQARLFLSECRRLNCVARVKKVEDELAGQTVLGEKRRQMLEIANELINWLISYAKGYDLQEGSITVREGTYLTRRGKEGCKTARRGECSQKEKNHERVERLAEEDERCGEIVRTMKKVMRFYWR